MKYSDSIKQMEKIMEKVNTIPKMCECINRWNIESPIIQVKDYYSAFSGIAQTENIFAKNAIGLTEKQIGDYKSAIDNLSLGLKVLGSTAAIQTEKIHMSMNPVLEAMKKYEGIHQELIECTNFGLTLQAASKQLSLLQGVIRNNLGLGIESASKIAGLSRAVTAFAEGLTAFTKSTSYQGVTKVLEQYQNSMDQILSSIQQMPLDKFEAMDHIWKDFNIDDVSISENGDLTYQGMTYEKEVVPQELERQVQEVREKDIPKQLEELKQKHWLLCFIIYILFLIPNIVETTTWYADVGQSMYEAVMDLPEMCYTIKEKSYIRAEANAKSGILATLVYDTKLEILEDIPRWYKVKYIDETGTETEGWISKISVEE